jgi:drug/metabolite transporter (DMT)-like permease
MVIDSWIVFTLIASFCFSGMVLLFRKLADLGTTTESINVFFFAGATIALWLFARSRQATLSLSMSALPWLLLAVGLAVGANHFSISALRSAPNPGYVTAFKVLDIVLVAGASFFLFGLSLSPVKLLGMGLCIAGLLFVALG